jgi:hypothetical protein
MAQRDRRLNGPELAHIMGRTVMGVGIGWGYLALVLTLDIGGWASWLASVPWGRVLEAQIFAVFAIAYGAVAAHVGYTNVMGAAVEAQRAEVAARREALRRWERR